MKILLTLTLLLLNFNSFASINAYTFFEGVLKDTISIDFQKYGIDRDDLVKRLVDEWYKDCGELLDPSMGDSAIIPDCPAITYSDEIDKMISPQVIRNFIIAYGAGKALDVILRDFEKQYRQMNDQIRADFDRIISDVRQREERERMERTRLPHRRGGEWGGHLDNRPNPNVARAGMGA